MSVEIILIPIAIAAVTGAIKARNEENQELTEAIKTRNEKNQESSGYFTLGTKIKDAKLLEETLKIYGCKDVSTGEDLETECDNARVIFEKDENGVFNAVFLGNISLEKAKEFISDINGEYTKLVQEQVYQKLLKNASERNLRLESEDVQEDNSIVLTFALQEEKI
ncbi:hypothetical protein [Methanobacterium sp. MBAC-LM]|jgi:hypothetical protein|uniref:hypothetical protein n=1 Tax=Methanobacterium sp. MBAC-LM TaxID=3412034 RepID=UPI003C75BDEE